MVWSARPVSCYQHASTPCSYLHPVLKVQPCEALQKEPHAEQVAVELCWRTCISSRSNGEELARSGGVEILGALLARCCAVLTPDAAPTAPAATIAAHALRALAGMAAFPHAQAELLARYSPARFGMQHMKHSTQQVKCAEWSGAS